MLFINEPLFHVIAKIATTEKPSSTSKVSLEKILKYIKEGNPQNSPEYYANLRTKPKPEIKKAKDFNIMSWLPSAAFIESSSFARNNIESLTGIMFFDFDLNSKEDAINYKAELIKIPYVIASWLSISEMGCGCLVSVSNVNLENYKEAYKQTAATLFNKEYDKACSNPERKNCLSYDKDLLINPAPVSFPYRNVQVNQNRLQLANANISLLNNVDTCNKPTNRENLNKEEKDAVSLLIEGIDSRTLDSLLQVEEVKTLCLLKREHWPIELKNIRLLQNNEILPEECISGLSYQVYDDKRTFYSVFKRCQEKGLIIPEGKRTMVQFSKGCSMLLNNAALVDKFGTAIIPVFYSWFNNINYISNDKPLDETTLIKMVTSIFNLYLQGELYSNHKKQKLIGWKQGNNLSVKEKLKIGAREGRKSVARKNKNKIFEAFNSLAEELLGEIPTQKQVKERSGCSIRTISQYWNELTVKEPKPINNIIAKEPGTYLILEKIFKSNKIEKLEIILQN